MKNFEKYKDVILNHDKDVDCFLCRLRNGKCDGVDCADCRKESIKWLYEEYKEPIKLTQAEKTILENMDKKWKWIARDKCGELFVYTNKPKKDENLWRDGECAGRTCFNHLFQFIQWSNDEPCNIEELLKNCEVKE